MMSSCPCSLASPLPSFSFCSYSICQHHLSLPLSLLLIAIDRCFRQQRITATHLKTIIPTTLQFLKGKLLLLFLLHNLRRINIPKGNQGICGCIFENVPRKHIFAFLVTVGWIVCLGRMRMCGFVGGYVTLVWFWGLKSLCHFQWDISVSFLWLRCKLSVTFPVPYLPLAVTHNMTVAG